MTYLYKFKRKLVWKWYYDIIAILTLTAAAAICVFSIIVYLTHG